MSRSQGLLLTMVVLLLVTPAYAQCHGTGARITTTPQAAGTTVVTTVTGPPGRSFGVWLSGGIEMTSFPGLGTVCLDLGTPIFGLAFEGVLDAGGTSSLATPIPATPVWLQIVYFLQGLVADPGQPLGFQLTNTVRKDYESPDSWVPVANLSGQRTTPSVAELSERGWVFATGGETGPTGNDIYFPLLRQAIPGPLMSTYRVQPTATTLLDGRVLIAGGAPTPVAAAANTCEIFDPVTLSMQPVPPMTTARIGHRAVLLSDGRVLVVGGSRYASTNIPASGAPPEAPFYANALESCEVFNPIAGTWTPVVTPMQVCRVGHSATRLQDGRVLIAGGFSSATFTGNTFLNLSAVPIPTASCEIFDPSTGTMSPVPSFTARGYHQATLRPDGTVFVSGGQTAQAVTGTTSLFSVALASTEIFSAGTWGAGPSLPSPRTRHGQILFPGGYVLVAGGISSLVNFGVWSLQAAAVIYDGGTSLRPAADLPAPSYDFGMARHPDGSILLLGGYMASGASIIPQTTIHLYTPQP